MIKTLVSLADTASVANNATGGTFISLGDGFVVFIFGMAVTFVALTVLIFITFVYPKIVRKLDRTEKKALQKTKVKKADSVKDAQPKEIVKEDNAAVVAAITAAVAACMGTSANGVVIRSISRTHQSLPSWGKSGRAEQIY